MKTTKQKRRRPVPAPVPFKLSDTPTPQDDWAAGAGITMIASGEMFAHEAEVCIRSIRQHTTLPIHVFTSTRKPFGEHVGLSFTDIEPEKGLWVKPKYMSKSPFPLTLFLDTDVVVVHPDAFLPFRLIRSRFDMAWCHAAKRGYSNMRGVPNCVSTWNSGVMFLNMLSPAMQKTLVEYRRRYAPHKKSHRVSDQAILSRLVWKNQINAYTLAPEWNCRGYISGCVAAHKVHIVHQRSAVRTLKRTGAINVRDYCIQANRF